MTLGFEPAPEAAHLAPVEAADAALRRKLKWLSIIRAVAAGFLAGGTAILGVEPLASFPLVIASEVGLYTLAVLMAALSSGYALALSAAQRPATVVFLAYVQLFGDAVFASAIVVMTGLSDSAFTFFFSLTIINGAVILYRRGAMFTAVLATAFMVAIGLYQYGQLPEIAPTGSGPVGKLGSGILWNLAVNAFAFFVVGYLASRLSDQLRRSELGMERQRGTFRDLKALHENIISSVRAGLVTVNRKRQVTLINRAGEDILGLEASDVFGRDVLEYLPELGPLLDEESAVPLPGLETTRAVAADDERHLEWTVSPLRDGTYQHIGHVLVFQDVTQVRLMEEEVKRAERFATIGRLAASIAHEIRNPLTSISGAIQVLGDGLDLPESDRRLMSIVSREADSLNHWISDFLMYARPRRGDRVPLDIARVVRDAVAVLKHDEKLANIETRVRADEEALVLADPTYIEQVVWNVLSNAAEAMPDGGVLSVVVQPQTEGPDDYVRLDFSDSGVGIPDADRGRLFEPFFTTKPAGTGLGLATVDRLVRDYGGFVTVESEVGVGTTFIIHLPRAAGHPSAAARAEAERADAEQVSTHG